MCESHQFSVSETVLCGVQAVRDALANVQNFDHFTSVVTGLKALSQNEFSGIGRPLFLRDRISLRLVCAPEDPEPITMALEDGWNIIHYSFRLQAAGENRTLVQCQVDCWNRQGESWVGPSERLAKMMMKHESKLGQRLKGYVEAGQQSVCAC